MERPPRQPDSFLHSPKDPRWAVEHDFSPLVAARLTSAYALLWHPSPGAYLRAYMLVAPCLRLSKSRRQQAQVFFALGAALLGDHAPNAGIENLGAALEIAEELDDLVACAELAHLSGAAARAYSQYALAADCQQYSLSQLRTLNGDGLPVDPQLEIGVLTALATCQFLLGDYEVARQHLDDTSRLSSFVADTDPKAAAIEWVAALLSRWSGQKEHALRHAVAAAEIYSQANSPAQHMAYARIQATVADIALDLAESLKDQGRQAFLALARPFARNAVKLTHDLGDISGEIPARLARVRYERVAGLSTDRLRLIESLRRRAQEIGDMACVCQTWTALGQELMHQGNTDSALNVYRRAVDVSIRYEMPANGHWAQRALFLDAEMRDN